MKVSATLADLKREFIVDTVPPKKPRALPPRGGVNALDWLIAEIDHQFTKPPTARRVASIGCSRSDLKRFRSLLVWLTKKYGRR